MKREFEDGDQIICIKDCFDNEGTLIHRKGETNKAFIRLGRIHIKLPENNPDVISGKSVPNHGVSQTYLSKHFIHLDEYREMTINKLLDSDYK